MILTAPPTRKLFIRSGSLKAAMYASVCGPAPKSQAMYLPRASPMRLDATDETASRIEAENTECECDGLSRRSPRVHHDASEPVAARPVAAELVGPGPDALFGISSVTRVDFIKSSWRAWRFLTG